MPEIIEEQHPIPQDISSYQFKLVGDMTLKQFVQVAGGALLALLLYSTPLHAYIRWPLMIISFLFGAALAFMPLEDRPLGKWMIIFFKSIYSPTVFIWKRSDKPISYFQPEGLKKDLAIAQEVVTPSTPAPAPDSTAEEERAALVALEHTEQNFLSKISHLFRLPTLTKTSASTTTSAQQATGGVNVPEPVVVTVTPGKDMAKSDLPPVDTKAEEIQKELRSVISQVTPTVDLKTQKSVHDAIFSASAAPPTPPTQENIIVGQVISPEGRIIEGAILEVKDDSGRPVRAFKTNKLGHFMIVTPLAIGRYEMEAEKEGYTFEPLTFTVEGKIIPPIAVKATGKVKIEVDQNTDTKKL